MMITTKPKVIFFSVVSRGPSHGHRQHTKISCAVLCIWFWRYAEHTYKHGDRDISHSFREGGGKVKQTES